MNPLIKIAILLLVDILIFRYIGVTFGVIGLLIISYRVLKLFGFFRNPSFFKGSFCEGIAFLKDYQGPYFKNRKAFEDALNLIKTFKLNEPKDGKEKYVVIGIYYDKPGEVEESKLRYSVGIYQKNKGFPEKPPRELETFCNSNDYYYAELPNASSLYSSWEYSNVFAMITGITKFNSGLKKNLNNPDFKRTYRIKDSDCKIIVELYETDSTIAFYAPLLNVDKFKLYKKDK